LSTSTRFRIAGLVSGILFLAGYCIVIVVPGGGDVTEKDITDFYASDGKGTLAYVLQAALAAGSLSVVWFFHEMRARLPESMLATMAGAASSFGAALAAAGGGIIVGPLGVQKASSMPFVGVPVAHAIVQAGLGVLLTGGMGALMVAVLLITLAARRASAVPSWAAIVGFIVAFIMLGSFVWAPGVVFPLWLVFLGIIGMKDTRQPA
jgi:hypothetical protein